MSVNTKTVQGRRDLHFTSLEQIVADAEKLVQAPRPRTLGNWPLANLLTHLASTVNNSIDGFPTKAPLLIRLIGPLIKGGMLKNKMKPGIQLPKAKQFFPDAASNQAALDDLRRAIERTKTERMTAPHPAFGTMTHDQWVQLHLRHSELHLSYALPE